MPTSKTNHDFSHWGDYLAQCNSWRGGVIHYRQHKGVRYRLYDPGDAIIHPDGSISTHLSLQREIIEERCHTWSTSNHCSKERVGWITIRRWEIPRGNSHKATMLMNAFANNDLSFLIEGNEEAFLLTGML